MISLFCYCFDQSFLSKTFISLPTKGKKCCMFHGILILWLATSVAAAPPPITFFRHGCQDRCGEVDIPYPFGIGAGCYMSSSFEVNCNHSFSPPKPFLANSKLELLQVSLTGYVQVNSPVISSNCRRTDSTSGVDLSGSSFYFSDIHNRFTATGCDNLARLLGKGGSIIGGCLSICNGTVQGDGCYGLNCCQTTIPVIDSFHATVSQVQNVSGGNCSSAFMVDQSWLDSFSKLDQISEMEYVPAVLGWANSPSQGSCDIDENSRSAFCSRNGFCWTQLAQNQFCVCSPSDPSLPDTNIQYTSGQCSGGKVKDCISATRSCSLICTSGNRCPCPEGYRSQMNGTVCNSISSTMTSKSRAKAILIGCGSGIGFLLILFASSWLYKLMKRRKAMKLRQQFFEKNGGLLLQQRLSSGENNVEQMKLFDAMELEKAIEQLEFHCIAILFVSLLFYFVCLLEVL